MTTKTRIIPSGIEVWEAASSGPTPSLSWGSESGVTTLTAQYGTAGTAGSAVLTGSNLSGDVTVAAPSGFQVSKTSATDGFADSVTVSPSSGSVSQQIWVRLTGAAVSASVTGNVGASGGGVSTAVNLSVSGAVTCFDAPDVDDSNTSAMEMDLRWTAVPGATSYKVEVATDEDFTDATPGGWTSAANITLSGSASPPSGWTTGGNTYTEANGLRLGKNGTTGSLTSPSPAASGLTGKRVKVTVNARYYNSDSTANLRVTVSGGPSWETGGTAWNFTMTDTVSPYVNYINVSDSQTAVTFEFATTINGKRAWIAGIDISTEGAGTPGSKVAEGTRTTAGVASGEGAWTVDGSSWQWTWDAEDEGLPEDTYYWRVTATGGTCSEADEGDVDLTAVTPTLTVSPSSLNLGSTTYGTAGSPQSFTVTGADLTAGVTVTPPAGVSVCLTSGGTYQTTALTVSQASVEASGGARVYVKLTGASVGSLAAGTTVSVASTGATTVNVGVSGTVTAVAPTVGSPTYASVTVNSATLGGKVTANGGAALTSGGVRYRESGTTAWTSVAGSVPVVGTAFTVSVTGLQPGKTYEFQAYAGNGTLTGYTATTTFTTPAPTLTVSPLSVTGMAAVQYQDGTPVNVSVSGANLMGNVTVTASAGFEVSTDDGASWGAEKYISVAGATLSATTVKVRIASGSGTGEVTGTLTVSSSNASDVTVSLAGNVSGATVDTGSWLGDSRLVLNGTWYKGTATEGSDPACPASLGYLTTLTLGGHVQTYGQNDGQTYPAYMTYSIDGGAETTVALIWYKYGPANNWFGMGGDAGQGQHVQTATTLDLSGLAGGSHTLTVYFSQPTSVGSGTLYDNSSTKVTYNVTFVVPAWNGPNVVYWREQAVDGHFVRQDDDGNHDPWWYQITPTVGFHNPNMTDYGPNTVIVNNNNQTAMTVDSACTVASFSFTSGASDARTIGGAALTVNSAITNRGGGMTFNAPVALGGNVKVDNTSGKTVTFAGGASGSGKTLTKVSAGTLELSSAVTVGTLAVNGGTVRLNTGGTLGGDVAVASGATFGTYPSASGDAVDCAGAISGAGAFQKQGNGTTTLSGANTFSGGATVTAGTLVAGSAGALGSGAVTVSGASAKLQIGVASASAGSVNFSGANSVLVTGPGKVLASTGNAVINKVTFDAGSYSGDDTQWAIVTSSSGTITLNGTLTVQNAPASGSCELELSGDAKTLYVTYHKPPAAPTLTVSQVSGNASQLSVTATPPSGASVVVVRNETGTFTSPSGTTLPNVDDTWAGGKVVSVTGGTFTDGGLTGCTRYYYKAWSLKNGLWSGTGTTDDEATVTPAAPTGLAEGTVTASSAELTWTAAAGAGGYLMDIVKGTSFGGGAGTVLTGASTDFSGFTAEDTVDRASSLSSYGLTGWSGSKIYPMVGYVRMGKKDEAGYLRTPGITSLPAGTTISFKVLRYNEKTAYLDVWVYDEDEVYEGVTGCLVSVGDSVELETLDDWTPVTVTTTEAYENTYLRFDLYDGEEAEDVRCYIDDIVVTVPGSSPTYVTADGKTYEQYDVGGLTSYTVTGLEEDTSYAWRLYTYGATTECSSDASAVDTFATPEDTSLTTVTISNYDADGESEGSNVAAGAVAAGQTALVQGTKLVVASGSVNPTLTGVTFTTTGTAGTGDLETYRVKVTQSATWAAGDTGLKGTVTAGAAGSHTVTFGSAQTLTAGQTYYVWIEAVTKAEATGGNTVGVAALTKDAFSMTGARKNGSTSATGLQTIGNLSSLSAAAVTGRADQGAVMSVSFGRSLAASQSGVLIRWSDVGYSEIPAPGTAWTKETTVAVGTASPVEVTGLTACKTYYFKAWEVVGGAAAGTVQQATGVVAAPAAPTGLGHGTPGAHNASLTWAAAAGATGYVIDLWHYEGGSGGGGSGSSGIAGTYTLVTDDEDLTQGNYVIVGVSGGTYYAMTNATGSTFVKAAALASSVVSGDGNTLTITADDADVVWNLENHTTYWTINNGSSYVIWTESTSKNESNLSEDSSVAKAQWSLSWNSEDSGWEINNHSTAGDRTHLRFNKPSSGDPRFACYSGGQTFARLYKQTGSGGGGGSGGTKVDDVIGGVVQAGSAVTVTASGATGVNVTGLADGTTYGWDVKAQGTECTGAASAEDTFTTAELLGAPTIVEPLTAGVEQLSGTITGAAGAQMILKRYESEDAAMAGTADGSLGGVVVPTTPGTGAAAGTWTFADTGLDGCKTYYYRAWQKATVDGELATSAGSNVASAQTELGTPVVTAVGAGTQMTISWNAVPGAVSYKVMLTDTEGVWTTTGGGSGTTQLRMDFAGITANNTELNTAANLTANGLTGWGATKVWTVVEEGEGATTLKYVKLGSGSAGGSLTTPQISAMSAGGKATFDLKTFTGGNGKSDSSTVTVAIKYTGDADFEPLKTFTPSTDWQNYQVSITGTKAFQLQLSSSAGNNRFHIDNLVVTENGSGGGTGGKVGLKYEATLTSAPFERTVDDLTMGATYWYKVIATGAEGCEKTSAVESGTPANAPLIQVTPMHYNFGTVTKHEGAVTADFIVRNTGSVDLKFDAVTLVQDGDAYSITYPAMVQQLTTSLAAGASRTYTVKFDPQVSGTRTATLRFVNDAYNVTGEVPVEGSEVYGNLEIPLTGTCYDPATADPTVYWLKVEDELGIEDTVTDQSMAHENDKPVLTVLTWHYNRSYRTLDRSSKATKWTLYDPNGDVVVTSGGTRLENQFFTAVEEYVYDGKTCAKFSAPIPALGTGKAVRGTYTVKVKVYDSTGTYWTETTHFVPIETGWLFDDFTRADREATGSGALENGWTAMTSGGAVAGEAAIHADALELYGANGECPGVAGRIAVARDMSDVGYATDPHDFVGTGSWGFHFKTGAKTVGFGDGSTAGAFVLGSTASTWLTATPGQVGYAVAMRDDAVQLVKFEGSLLAGGTITQLGEAQYSGAQGKLLAVRVDFLPGQDEVDADAADDGVAHAAVPAKYRLYVKEVAKTGGSPIAECTAADKVLEWEFPAPEDHNLRYAGMMWNHGVAQVSDKTGAMFDDIYLPHMEGQTEPMMFHVIDEDTEGPVFDDFDLPAAVAAGTVNSEGLTVHGTVRDASGIWTAAGSPSWDSRAADPKWELWVDGVKKAEGKGSFSPDGNGAGTEVAWTIEIPSGLSLGTTTDCELRLSAWDHDIDREDDSTQGTAVLGFTLCAATPTSPAWATVEGDGAEMAVLRWARTAGATYVVVRSDDEIGERATPEQGTTTAPAEGTTYAGLGKVVYAGTGDEHLTGTWTAREFIVDDGSTNYFAVYGMTGDAATGYYFSAPALPTAWAWATTNAETGAVTAHTAVNGSGVPVAGSVTEGAQPLATPKYEPGEGVDAFAYRTSVPEIGEADPQGLALPFNYETRPETGSGWADGGWSENAEGTWKIHDTSLPAGETDYPEPAGNKLYWQDASGSAAGLARMERTLATPASGDFFVAALVNYQYPGDGKWVNIVLLDESDRVIASFGKQGGSGVSANAAILVPQRFGGGSGDETISVPEYNTSQATFQLAPEQEATDAGYIGNDYVIVGQVSKSEDRFRMWAYYAGPIPETPNSAQKKAAMGRTYDTATRADMLARSQIPQIFADSEGGACATNQVTASWYKAGLGDSVGNVVKIRLEAGSDADKGVLGHVYFDEIRFGGSWEEMFLFNAPEVFKFDFDKPEEGTGIMVGYDKDGHRQWQISDGALAHGDVGLNAQFELYHRTGIQSASFTIKDGEGNTILKNVEEDDDPETEWDERLARESDAAGRVELSGLEGRAYSDWTTAAGGATGTAIPTNRISLDETYTVEVTLKSAGGKEATVTSASETGGAGSTDLFFGEYGEGRYWDKYVEIYNGTGHDIDLYDYYIFRPKASGNDFSSTYDNLIPHESAPFARISPTKGANLIGHGETIVLLNYMTTLSGDNQSIFNERLSALEKALDDREPPAKHLRMPNEVLNSSGNVPYLLVKAEDFNEATVTAAMGSTPVSLKWLDACGMATAVVNHPEDAYKDEANRQKGRYIMSRKNTATYLPRSKPMIIDTNEWDYRDWSWPWGCTGYANVDDNATGYTNFIATAGENDRKIGLGGNMEFKVFDDDIEPPTLVRGGVRVRKADGTLEEDYRAVSAGDRTYVVGGWSFTTMPTGVAVADLTLEQYQEIAEMWPGGLTQNGGLSWSSELGGDDLAGWANVIEAGNGKGQSNVEFDGMTQRKYGAMIARASGSYAKDDEVWLGFDLDVAQLTDGMLTFGYAGGNAGFKNAYVAWSATGEEGSFKMPNEWNFDPNSGGASTWSEWSRSLDTESTGIPASAGHLWFRVYLSDYGTTVGTFRMDNMRVEGAPSVVRVTDAEICNRGMQFEVHVKDAASGLDAGTTGAQSSDDGKAYFDCGLGTTDKYRTVTLADGGKSESTITWTAANAEKTGPVTTGWGPQLAHAWYEETQAGHGKLRLNVPDADDDRADDQTMLRSDFGMLMVEDDDEAPPVLDMATMKPRQEGTMAEWLLAEKTTVASETMDALAVGTLGLNTTEGTTSRPRYSERLSADTGLSYKSYAVYQSGWQAESKYWTVKIRNTSGGAGTITKISFVSQVGSVLAPTGFEVKYGVVDNGVTGEEAGTTWSGSLLTSGTAWVKEGAAEGTTGSPIKTWANYEKTVSIPLAASGTSGDEIELRIYGTGTDPKGIGATWYLWDLKIEGEISVPGEGGEDGYTYVTDASLAQPGGANLPMSGSVYDEDSGLGAVPTYELKRGNKTVSSGEITFKAARDLSARTAKELGEFEQDIAVSGLGYADLALAEYKGTVHAVDADHDREDAGGNNMDQQDLDGQFAFTVIDQDLVGPTAPENVKVNGTAVPNAAPEYGTPAWNEAPWTNKPEFLVSFDVAEDLVPTAADLADETWLAAHGVEAASVKKAKEQTGAAGIGEYRVALATGAAVLSNAPAFSVAVAEGAVANYGFERTSEALQAWRLTDTAGIRAAGDRAFPGSTTVAPAPCEGTNSLFVPSGNVGGTGGGGAIGAPQSQVILFENTAHVAPKVGGSFWYYKVKNTSSPRVRISAYPNENMVAEERIAFRVMNPSTDSTSAGEWHQATFEFAAIGDGNANCILLELYSGNDYSFFDDVRIGVDVGTGNLPTMRYVATGPEAQGLNAKHLFAVDADNNRVQDRMVGERAVFYTPYDCTPPTAVAFIGHETGASADTDDPTTQFDLTWTTSNVGPDDTESDEYAAMPAANKRGRNSLSPWGTFRVYYRTYDPIALEAAATEAKAPSTAEYLYKTLVCGPSDGWGGSGEETAFYHDPSPELGWKHVENGDEIEDTTATVSAEVVDGKRKYSGWNVIGEGAQQTVRLYDLDFDQEYVVVVVGVDKAGNEGPVNSSSWATNNTIKFSITRGWHVPKTEAVQAFSSIEGLENIGKRLTNSVVSALKWTAAELVTTNEMVIDDETVQVVTTNVTKDYDLLQWDARSFRESPDNDWKLIQTVRSDWFVDDGGPTNRGAIRFYRASYKDRWKKAVTNATTGQVTAQTPLVSEEVYAQTAVRLRPGPNFVALHGVPYTNTFRAVFGGTENFPGGVSETLQGTSIDFYPAVSSTNGIALDHYWLRDDGQWFRNGDAENAVTDTRQDPDFFNRAFSINLPDELPEGDYPISSQEIHHPGGRVETVQTLLWKPILQVPTNGFSQTIHLGTKENPKFNIMALRLPVAAHPSEMGLVVPTAGSTETEGLTPGQPWVADQIYTIDPVTRDTSQACYCRMEDGKPVWRFAAGNGLVPAGYFKPNDVLVILSRNGGDPDGKEDRTWTWEYDPADFYPLPNRHMQAGE